MKDILKIQHKKEITFCNYSRFEKVSKDIKKTTMSKLIFTIKR